MASIELDWEFNAPHWFDFAQEDVDNPDAWFEEEAAKSADRGQIAEADHLTASTLGLKRKGTKIPVHRLKGRRGNAGFGTQSQIELVSRVGLKPSGAAVRVRTATEKQPARIPLNERRNVNVANTQSMFLRSTPAPK
jgi:hypothetical protein